MTADEPFLSRWSKRKSAVRAGATVPAELAPPPAPAAKDPKAAASPPVEPGQPLPAVESLTPDSDFTAFMEPEVDEGVKRQALKTLFADPRFNVMDGLDVYIDDYSKPDPMPESWLSQLNQAARLGAFEDKSEAAPDPAPPAPRELPAGAAGRVPEPVEKPSPEQGFAQSPSSDTADTPDGGIAAPPVPE